jgi:hypothetical protein
VGAASGAASCCAERGRDKQMGGRTCRSRHAFCQLPVFFVKSQDPKGQMKFERTPDIPANAGDGLAYGVFCLQFLDSGSLTICKRNFLLDTQFFSNVKFG